MTTTRLNNSHPEGYEITFFCHHYCIHSWVLHPLKFICGGKRVNHFWTCGFATFSHEQPCIKKINIFLIHHCDRYFLFLCYKSKATFNSAFILITILDRDICVWNLSTLYLTIYHLTNISNCPLRKPSITHWRPLSVSAVHIILCNCIIIKIISYKDMLTFILETFILLVIISIYTPDYLHN